MARDRLLRNPLVHFGDVVLRGVAEVFLQNNPLTGLIFLVGIFISSYIAGLYALLATVVATGTAMLLGVPREQVDKGMYGFNGTLTGLALAYYMAHDAVLPFYIILAAIFVTIATAFIQDALSPVNVPILTSSFVLTTWIFLAALYNFGRLVGGPALGAAHLPANAGLTAAVLTPTDAWMGFLNGVAQVMFQLNIWTGVAILIGLLVNSRISCAAAIVGSLVGLGVAKALGGSASAVREGLYGFNPVLTAVDLGGIYYLLSGRTVLFTFVATIVTAVTYGTLATILAPVGLPVLTAAFVIVTWICLISKKSLTRLQPIPPDAITTAEEHLAAAFRKLGR
ncbi:MAG TPA: urea transporter [Thermomicrobiales bacterium]|nr:urea transporter [Thermomicrobiales bacterium]